MFRIRTIQINSAWAALALVASSQAFALSTLKQVQVSGASQVDLLFDSKVAKNQIRTEFFNDIIQISLTDSAVYPAKISTVKGDSLVKIFAYQYAPKLIRCRLTVKGKAEDYKDKVQIQTNGKILTIKIDGSAVPAEEAKSDSITTRAAQALRADSSPAAKGDSKVTPAAVGPVGPMGPQIKIDDPEQKALLDRVIKAQVAPAAPVKTESAKAEPKAKAEEAKQDSSDVKLGMEARHEPLAKGKSLPSPFSVMGKLAAVLALFGLFAVGLKKFKGGKQLGAIGKFAKNKFGKEGKMIEVISTHYLGPKKSIAVVRIASRTLVLGVTNDSINLITQIDGAGGAADTMAALDALDIEDFGEPAPAVSHAPTRPTPASPSRFAGGAGAVSAGAPRFSDLLQTESVKPDAGVRARIRSKLEGYKQL